jgi:hypothetical protein
LHSSAAHTGSGIVDHPVGADPSLLPGFRGDEMRIQDQRHRSGNELVEVLDSDLDPFSLVQLDGNRIAVYLRKVTEGGEKVTHPTF